MSLPHESQHSGISPASAAREQASEFGIGPNSTVFSLVAEGDAFWQTWACELIQRWLTTDPEQFLLAHCPAWERRNWGNSKKSWWCLRLPSQHPWVQHSTILVAVTYFSQFPLVTITFTTFFQSPLPSKNFHERNRTISRTIRSIIVHCRQPPVKHNTVLTYLSRTRCLASTSLSMS